MQFHQYYFPSCCKVPFPNGEYSGKTKQSKEEKKKVKQNQPFLAMKLSARPEGMCSVSLTHFERN